MRHQGGNRRPSISILRGGAAAVKRFFASMAGEAGHPACGLDFHRQLGRRRAMLSRELRILRIAMYNVANELQHVILRRILENRTCDPIAGLGSAVTRSIGGVVRWGFVSIVPMGIS